MHSSGHDTLQSMFSSRAAKNTSKCVCACEYTPAKDFQQLCDSVEVLSFIYEPEDQKENTHAKTDLC